MEGSSRTPPSQGGIAPFVVGRWSSTRARQGELGGLAVTAGFAVAVALASGLDVHAADRRPEVALLGLAAPVAGMVVDSPSGRPDAADVPIEPPAAVLTGARVRERAAAEVGGRSAVVGGGTVVFVAWLVGRPSTSRVNRCARARRRDSRLGHRRFGDPRGIGAARPLRPCDRRGCRRVRPGADAHRQEDRRGARRLPCPRRSLRGWSRPLHWCSHSCPGTVSSRSD